MPRGVNYPVYVPSSCREAIKLIGLGRIDDAVAMIERKTAFGDTSAAALLGYLLLRGAIANPKLDLIKMHLRKAADSGDAYAEFVYALYMRAMNVPIAAERWMSKSAEQLFPPAQAHLGRFMIHGIGYKEPDRKSALGMYWYALRHGHVPSLAFIADWLRTSPNFLIRCIGYVAFPIASIASTIQILVAPFSVRSFVHLHDEERPLFSK